MDYNGNSIERFIIMCNGVYIYILYYIILYYIVLYYIILYYIILYYIILDIYIYIYYIYVILYQNRRKMTKMESASSNLRSGQNPWEKGSDT